MFASSIKGWFGELYGNMAQHFFLDNSVYFPLNNITIPTPDGSTTQIDHIIVSQYGIFVVEAKNMDGWIFGGEHQKFWTQSFPRKKFKFQNPLHQNYRHTKSLSEFLNIEHDRFHSVVMFWGDSTFKTNMPKNVLDKGYSAYITSKSELLFTPSQVQQIIQAIQEGALPKSWTTHFKHVANLSDRFETIPPSKIKPKPKPKVRVPQKQTCPKCDGTLNLRTAKTGQWEGNQFYGCSNFPKCRYIMNLTTQKRPKEAT